MPVLSLIWLVIGLLIGLLACGARLRPVLWGKRRWLVMLAIGMVSALLGGWLGVWLFGPQFATMTALWIGVVGVCLPWLLVGRTNGAKLHADDSSQSNPVITRDPIL